VRRVARGCEAAGSKKPEAYSLNTLRIFTRRDDADAGQGAGRAPLFRFHSMRQQDEGSYCGVIDCILLSEQCIRLNTVEVLHFDTCNVIRWISYLLFYFFKMAQDLLVPPTWDSGTYPEY
jgi:hypothetical protein